MRKKIQDRWEDKWKFRGDMVVVAFPIMIAAVENAPNLQVNAAYWIIQSLSILLAIAHFHAKTQQDS